MDQLEHNQDALREGVSQVRAQMGQLMKTTQAVSRGQDIMARMQEKMNQRNHVVVTLIHATNLPTIDNLVPPQGHAPVQIPVGAPNYVPPPVFPPPVIEIDDQKDSFFIPRVACVYDTFGPLANKVEKKVRPIEEKLRAIERSNTIGLDIAEMCLVSGVLIPNKFKVPNFEKYKGASDPITRIRAYCRKMAAYFDDDRLLMHFFQDSLSEASLDWYIQLEGTHIRS